MLCLGSDAASRTGSSSLPAAWLQPRLALSALQVHTPAQLQLACQLLACQQGCLAALHLLSSGLAAAASRGNPDAQLPLTAQLVASDQSSMRCALCRPVRCTRRHRPHAALQRPP